MNKKIRTAPYPWHLLPVHIVTSVAFLAVRIIIILIGLPACAVGVWVNGFYHYSQYPRFLRWLWPWDSEAGTAPEAWWWGSGHWSQRLGDNFSIWWWRAVRNPASNFTRFSMGDDRRVDVRATESSRGSPYMDPHENMTAKTYWQVRWDTRKWWLSEFYFIHVWSETRYLALRLGFKVGREFVGIGFTSRVFLYKKY